jgi:ankyrin repeat protein
LFSDAVEFLIQLGAPIDAQNLAGDTPLHTAVNKNYLGIAKYLLNKGANPDIKNKKGQNPSALAKSTEIRKILKERAHEKELQSLGMATSAVDNDMVCGEDDDEPDSE